MDRGSAEEKIAIQSAQGQCFLGKDRCKKVLSGKGSPVTSVHQALLLSQLTVHLLELRSKSSSSFPHYTVRRRPCGSGPRR